jgi:hypothetical protein
MTGLRAFLRPFSTRPLSGGWRGLLLLGFLAVMLTLLPEARALLTLGVLGGIVLGVFLILIRHQPRNGPRRGTPIVLFPRPVTRVDLLSRSRIATASMLA